MRVTFVLPSPARVPMGGAKVVVEYARRLVQRGHRVTVVGPERPGDRLQDRLFAVAVAARDRLHRVPDRPYFEAAGVDTRTVPTPAARYLPDADVVVATGWQTAEWVAALPRAKGAKGYFIQGHEAYLDARARPTWSLPLARFTCAQWLAEVVREEGLPVLGYLPNAVDPQEFALDESVEDRAPRLLWLYHRHPIKGPTEGVEAIRHVQRSVPEVEVDVFAARPPSHRLPDNVRVHVRPSRAHLRALYNAASVFLHSSHVEGWPLPPMEAMACGAAVVATANPGVREYLDASCGRLVPVGDASAMAEAICQLLTRAAERETLAAAGLARVARFSWEASTDRLQGVLDQIAAGEGTP